VREFVIFSFHFFTSVIYRCFLLSRIFTSVILKAFFSTSNEQRAEADLEVRQTTA